MLRIAFEGDATSHLSMSCTAHEMRNSLESIPSIGSILVSRNEILNRMDEHTLHLSFTTKDTGATNSTDYFIYVRKEIDAYSWYLYVKDLFEGIRGINTSLMKALFTRIVTKSEIVRSYKEKYNCNKLLITKRILEIFQ